MSRGVIAQVRDIVPIRPLTRAEAYRIAELQAAKFLEVSGITNGPVCETAISELPYVRVQRLSPLPVSGATQWSNGTWMVLLNGGEVMARQRFSLAHEFKHILDHRFIDILYQRIPEPDRHAFIESVCDYFSGCLLMPRPWMKRLWGEGVQRPADLAKQFGVSQLAAQVRLSQLGLGERPARCSRVDPRWTLPWDRSAGTTRRYHRPAFPVPT
jgi:hypothetical protein